MIMILSSVIKLVALYIEYSRTFFFLFFIVFSQCRCSSCPRIAVKVERDAIRRVLAPLACKPISAAKEHTHTPCDLIESKLKLKFLFLGGADGQRIPKESDRGLFQLKGTPSQDVAAYGACHMLNGPRRNSLHTCIATK